MKEKSKYQVKCRLKSGDDVIVLAGKNRGETGKISRIDRKTDRAYVEGVNIAKRNTKPSAANPQGGIVDKVMPLHISNLALVDPKTKKPTRIGYKVEDGKKVRFAKKSGTVLA